MTTKQAVEQVLEALRRLRTIAHDQGDYGSESVAGAALDAWEGRERLQNDNDLAADVKHWGPAGTRTDDASAILGAVDEHLFGSLTQASADATKGGVRWPSR